jgi:hypothetical protein
MEQSNASGIISLAARFIRSMTKPFSLAVMPRTVIKR